MAMMFHSLLAAHGSNQRLCVLRRSKKKWRHAASVNEHRVLIDAIEQGDATRAERVMHDHLMAQPGALRALRAHEFAQGISHA